MKINEIITEDIDRRGFLRGLGAAGLLGTVGYGALQQKKRMPTNDGEAAPSVQNRQDITEPVKGAPVAPTVAPQPQKVVQKYTPKVLKQYIIDYAKKTLPQNQVAPFIAQVDHESHGFRSLEENLNYSAPVLSKKYPKLFTKQKAEYVANHPSRDQIIANTIYGNRMGNDDPGDGYKYRGRGYIQLTGKENYERMSKLIGVDLVNNPDLASQPNYAAQIAVIYWKTRVANKGNTNNIAQVTKRISGSAKQGIKSRVEKLKQYTRELGNNKNSKSK